MQSKIIASSVIPETLHFLMSFSADTGVHSHIYSGTECEEGQTDTSALMLHLGFCLTGGMFWFCLIHSCQRHYRYLTLTRQLRIFFKHTHTSTDMGE